MGHLQQPLPGLLDVCVEHRGGSPKGWQGTFLEEKALRAVQGVCVLNMAVGRGVQAQETACVDKEGGRRSRGLWQD